MSKESDERYTPEDVLDVVRAFAGGPIALDPCTTADNRTRALSFYTKETNGLAQKWVAPLFGPAPSTLRVTWVNPPYSRGALPLWVEKILTSCHTRETPHIVSLLPNDLGSKAGQRVARYATMLCFPKGRIRFITPGVGQAKTGAKQPSVIAYWGDQQDRFEEYFSHLGACRG